MKKKAAFILLVFSTLGFTGCSNYFPGWFEPNGVNGVGPNKSVNSPARTLCDVDRTRVRAELLKQLHVEKFRAYATAVSRQVTQDEMSDLKRLDATRSDDDGSSWEIGRRRAELISEIYTGAIIRAGFRPSVPEDIQGTSLSCILGTETLSSGNDPYVTILTGRLSKNLPEEGSIAHITLGANPDQNRYYVGIYRLTRFETQSDGSRIPVFTSLSLADAAEEKVSYSCHRLGSDLKPEDFNTIPSMGSAEPESQPSPSTASSPTPRPVMTPSPAPSRSP